METRAACAGEGGESLCGTNENQHDTWRFPLSSKWAVARRRAQWRDVLLNCAACLRVHMVVHAKGALGARWLPTNTRAGNEKFG